MKIGIWLDIREAYIIKVSPMAKEIQHVTSNVESYNPKGGSRSNVPYGPVETVSESKYHEKKKHQESAYFDHIITLIKQDSEIMILGPAQAKFKFRKHIESTSYPNIKILDCIQADSMTVNQMEAFVKDYFNLSQ
jgi:hypothetical protein